MKMNYKVAAALSLIMLLGMAYFAIVGDIGTASTIVKIVYIAIAAIFAMLFSIAASKILNEKFK